MLSREDLKNWAMLALAGVAFWAFALSAFAQQSPSVSVSGNLVTISADLAWHDPDLEGVEVIQGTPLSSPSVFASTDGASPIVLRMPPGTHTIDALGFPADRMNPQREYLTLPAVVEVPSRQDRLNELYATYLEARDKILELSPTRAEAIEAILNYARKGR